MQIISTYSVKIKHYNNIFAETISAYRLAVDYFIEVALKEWTMIEPFGSVDYRQSAIEQLTVRTKKRQNPAYPFEEANQVFYKFPSYLRRSAINEAVGKVSSFMSNLTN